MNRNLYLQQRVGEMLEELGDRPSRACAERTGWARRLEVLVHDVHAEVGIEPAPCDDWRAEQQAQLERLAELLERSPGRWAAADAGLGERITVALEVEPTEYLERAGLDEAAEHATEAPATVRHRAIATGDGYATVVDTIRSHRVALLEVEWWPGWPAGGLR